MQTTAEKLNEKLFEAIDGLLNKETPMDIGRATAIAKSAKVIVDNERNSISKIRLMAKYKPDELPKLNA